ncbi:hypothetical protein [Streptomyces sp. NPDC091278]|uniref:hypothetical protein n=1 Tax=Streptomyces sp. NPDC091278 TaxID=3155301 RepID=UPI00344D578E
MSTQTADRLVFPGVATAGELADQVIAARGEPSWEAPDDVADLRDLVRGLLDLNAGRDLRVRLGGRFFEVVITSSGAGAREAVEVMDRHQGRCGPVIDDPRNGWFYWLVPPGSTSRWTPHPSAVCLGAPHVLTMPPPERRAGPRPFWHRPPASDRLVPAGPLWDLLVHYRPEPAPHPHLEQHLGITV